MKGEQLDKLKELGASEGIDFDAFIKEISDGIEGNLASKMKLGLEDVEMKLGQKIEHGQKAIGQEIGQSISALVETAVTAKLPSVVESVGGEFMAKLKEKAGNSGSATGSGGLGGFLNQLTAADAIEILKVWKEPTTTEALKGQMGLLIQGMNLGLRLKASPEVVTEMAKTVEQGFG